MRVLNSIQHLPRHNILFAGVQFIMLRDGAGPLGGYYPNFTAEPRDSADLSTVFEAFVLDHESELIEIGRTRYTQTNECRRCVALLPGIWLTPAERFHLVDLGTSAGLNLLLDRYRYRWGETTWGPTASAVSLETNMRGVDVRTRPLEVVSRTGLDLNPVDPSDPEDRRWLEALVWPEHEERRVRLRAALEMAAAQGPRVVAGDAHTILRAVLRDLPEGEPVVVINSFVLNQMGQESRLQLGTIIDEGRRRAPIYRVSMEWLDRRADGADLAVDVGSGLQPVGKGHPHGEWLELYARP